MLVWKVGNMLYKKGNFDNKNKKWQGKRKDKEEISPCYHYKKPEYLIVDFLAMKIKVSTSKNSYKKSATKAKWNDTESDSDRRVLWHQATTHMRCNLNSL